jgi:hypothetical protein
LQLPVSCPALGIFAAQRQQLPNLGTSCAPARRASQSPLSELAESPSAGVTLLGPYGSPAKVAKCPRKYACEVRDAPAEDALYSGNPAAGRLFSPCCSEQCGQELLLSRDLWVMSYVPGVLLATLGLKSAAQSDQLV